MLNEYVRTYIEDYRCLMSMYLPTAKTMGILKCTRYEPPNRVNRSQYKDEIDGSGCGVVGRAEIRSSNPVISKFYSISTVLNCFQTMKIRRPEIDQFLK